MESNMFTRPEVASELSRFVPVELFTDGAGPAYERNKALEEQRFGTVALPLYAVVSPDGQRRLGESPGLTRDTAEFLRFLRQTRGAATQVAERTPVRSRPAPLTPIQAGSNPAAP